MASRFSSQAQPRTTSSRDPQPARPSSRSKSPAGSARPDVISARMASFSNRDSRPLRQRDLGDIVREQKELEARYDPEVQRQKEQERLKEQQKRKGDDALKALGGIMSAARKRSDFADDSRRTRRSEAELERMRSNRQDFVRARDTAHAEREAYNKMSVSERVMEDFERNFRPREVAGEDGGPSVRFNNYDSRGTLVAHQSYMRNQSDNRRRERELNMPAPPDPIGAPSGTVMKLDGVARRTTVDVLQYNVIPLWEERIRLTLERTVPFVVDWRSFETAPTFERSIDALMDQDGRLVFERIAVAIEELCREYGDAKLILSQGLFQIKLKLVYWGYEATAERRPERCFVERIRPEDGERQMEVDLNGNPVKPVLRTQGGRIPVDRPDLAAAAAARQSGFVDPRDAVHSRFALKICCRFNLGDEACFTKDEIKTALRVGLGFQDTNPYDHLNESVIPRWQQRVVDVLGRPIPFDVNWQSFHDPRQGGPLNDVITTLDFNNGELVFGRVASAISQIVDQYPDGRSALANRLSLVTIKHTSGTADRLQCKIRAARDIRNPYDSPMGRSASRYRSHVTEDGYRVDEPIDGGDERALVPRMHLDRFGRPVYPPSGYEHMASTGSPMPGANGAGGYGEDAIILKLVCALEAGAEGCPSVAFIKHQLLTALNLDYLPADVRYSVVPVWEAQLRELLPRLGTQSLIQVQWSSFEHALDPEAAMMTLHHENGKLVFAPLVTAIREICTEYEDGRAKLLESLVRIRLKHLPGDDLDRLKCQVKPVVLLHDSGAEVAASQEQQLTRMPMANARMWNNKEGTEVVATIPDLTKIVVERPQPETRSSIAELKLFCAFEHGAKGCFTKGYIKNVLLEALQIRPGNQKQDIDDFVLPTWENRLRRALGVPVIFEVDWESLQQSRNFNASVTTLVMQQGGLVFRRIVEAGDEMRRLYDDRCPSASEGFLKVVIHNSRLDPTRHASKAQSQDEMRIYVQEMGTVHETKLQERPFSATARESAQKRILAAVDAKLSRAERSTAQTENAEIFALSSVTLPNFDHSERLLRRFELHIALPLEEGARGCFTQDEIKDVLLPVFQAQLDRGNYLDILRFELVPHWEGIIRQMVGRTIPIVIDWRSFENAVEYARGVETLLVRRGELVFGQIVNAIRAVCQRNVRAVRLLSESLYGIMIALAPGHDPKLIDAALVNVTAAEGQSRSVQVSDIEWGHPAARRGPGGPPDRRGGPRPGPADPREPWSQKPSFSDFEPGTVQNQYSKLAHRVIDEDNERFGASSKDRKPKLLLKLTGTFEMGDAGCIDAGAIANVLTQTYGIDQQQDVTDVKNGLIPHYERRLRDILHHPLRFAIHWDSIYQAENTQAAVSTLSAADGEFVFGRIVSAVADIVAKHPQAGVAMARRFDFISIKLCPPSRAQRMYCKVKQYIDNTVRQSGPSSFVDRAPPPPPKIVLKIKCCLELGPKGCYEVEDIREVLLKGLGLDQRVVMEIIKTNLIPMWEDRITHEIGAPVQIHVEWETFRVQAAETALEALRLVFARIAGAIAEIVMESRRGADLIRDSLHAIRIKSVPGEDMGQMGIKLSSIGMAGRQRARLSLNVKGCYELGPQGCHTQGEIKNYILEGLEVQRSGGSVRKGAKRVEDSKRSDSSRRRDDRPANAPYRPIESEADRRSSRDPRDSRGGPRDPRGPPPGPDPRLASGRGGQRPALPPPGQTRPLPARVPPPSAAGPGLVSQPGRSRFESGPGPVPVSSRPVQSRFA